MSKRKFLDFSRDEFQNVISFKFKCDFKTWVYRVMKYELTLGLYGNGRCFGSTRSKSLGLL